LHPGNEGILFVGDEDATSATVYDVFWLPLPGGDPVDLTGAVVPEPAVDVLRPQPSPAGDAVAINVSNDELMVTRAAAAPEPLTMQPLSGGGTIGFTWSPDGRSLLVDSQPPGGSGPWTRVLVPYTPGAGHSLGAPIALEQDAPAQFAPDGQGLALLVPGAAPAGATLLWRPLISGVPEAAVTLATDVSVGPSALTFVPSGAGVFVLQGAGHQLYWVGLRDGVGAIELVHDAGADLIRGVFVDGRSAAYAFEVGDPEAESWQLFAGRLEAANPSDDASDAVQPSTPVQLSAAGCSSPVFRH
jgi:hypothetical protein